MAKTLRTADDFQEYLEAAMDRAIDHGPEVAAIVLMLAGATLWKKEGDIQVRTHGAVTANALWVHINGRRYAFSYVHPDKNANQPGRIEIRKDSLRGIPIKMFDNSSKPINVLHFFMGL